MIVHCSIPISFDVNTPITTTICDTEITLKLKGSPLDIDYISNDDKGDDISVSADCELVHFDLNNVGMYFIYCNVFY